MNKKITVIIPTYKSPLALDICLNSLLKGQIEENEILVVVDGFYEINKEILNKYQSKIKILDLVSNMGLCRATNMGVYNASNDLILIINDDNVAPIHWDERLLKHYEPKSILTPNQIEPTESIFSPFVILNLGQKPEEFDYEKFLKSEQEISVPQKDDKGGTLPIFMNKYDYLMFGGWDENYPMGLVADWEFFYKAELAGLKLERTYNCHFYHFGSLTTKKTTEDILNRQVLERNAHEYFNYKWGKYISMNTHTMKRMLI